MTGIPGRAEALKHLTHLKPMAGFRIVDIPGPGVLVTGTLKDGPAHRAGLRDGYIVYMVSQNSLFFIFFVFYFLCFLLGCG